MIGDAVVGEVVSAYFFRAVAGPDLLAAEVGYVAGRLDLLDIVELGAENIHRFLAVRVLGPFLARGDNDAGRL